MNFKNYKIIILFYFIVLVSTTILILHFEGRLFISKSGEIHFWISDAWGSETSQHFLDPYSLTHFIHGFLFYGLLYLALKKQDLRWKFLLAIFFESIWEILENSPLIINRYREATAALGYSGDTILNSFGDICSCALGFIAAKYLGLKKSILLIFIIELSLLITIKDCLLVNIIMLIYPIESIKAWQMQNL